MRICRVGGQGIRNATRFPSFVPFLPLFLIDVDNLNWCDCSFRTVPRPVPLATTASTTVTVIVLVLLLLRRFIHSSSSSSFRFTITPLFGIVNRSIHLSITRTSKQEPKETNVGIIYHNKLNSNTPTFTKQKKTTSATVVTNTTTPLSTTTVERLSPPPVF
mmetsp:Transcript_57203/g.139463  ORF Transcript_57203/g.139463 Transcript_57203/m.139463 type:complete len:161 (-) Transcript_57203:1705-2187(-)